jgi:hypothetical protein
MRKLNLTIHIISSVGWLGAIATFLVLCVVGLTSQHSDTMRAAYLVMSSIAWCILVPFALAAFVTGLIHSLGTEWGLFRHCWILVKLLLTLLATVVLLMKLSIIQQVGILAENNVLDGLNHHQAKTELLTHAVGGLLVVLAAAILSVYKPWGLTRYGQRKLLMRRAPSTAILSAISNNSAPIPLGLKLFLGIGIVVIAAFVLLHLSGGHGGHGH